MHIIKSHVYNCYFEIIREVTWSVHKFNIVCIQTVCLPLLPESTIPSPTDIIKWRPNCLRKSDPSLATANFKKTRKHLFVKPIVKVIRSQAVKMCPQNKNEKYFL